MKSAPTKPQPTPRLLRAIVLNSKTRQVTDLCNPNGQAAGSGRS